MNTKMCFYQFVIFQNTRLGGCYGFSITSLDQLSALVANVTSQGTNFVHYLVTVSICNPVQFSLS